MPDSTAIRAHAEDLAAFVAASPSSFHAAAEVARRLRDAGFTALAEDQAWPHAAGGKHLVVRDGAVIAWVVPTRADAATPVRVFGAHSDSPAFKLKPKPTTGRLGWLQAGVEIYGGPLLNSWLDRELRLAGRLALADGRVVLAATGPLLRLPQLAIHLDREANDLLLQAAIQDNIALPTLPMRSKWGVTSRRDDALQSSRIIEQLAIACRGPADLPANLSGGNRQKVVLGKWMLRRPRLLVLQNPTRGVDVGAKSLIYRTLRDLAGQGTAILLISDELNELRGMSDHIVIMRRGAVTGQFDAHMSPSEEDLVACMV